MKLMISYKKIPDLVFFPEEKFISRKRLAEALTKRDPYGDGRVFSKQLVSLWIKSGRMPHELIPTIKKIPLGEIQAQIVVTRTPRKAVGNGR